MVQHLCLAHSAVSAKTRNGFVNRLKNTSLKYLDAKGLANFEQETREMKECLNRGGFADLILETYIDKCKRRYNKRNDVREGLLHKARVAASLCNVSEMNEYVEQAREYKPLSYDENAWLKEILLKALTKKKESNDSTDKDKTRVIDISRIALAGA
jgi:hypothetical protein